MDDNLHELEAWAGMLLGKLAPVQRRAAMQDIGRELRRSHQARIAAQQNPDGSSYAARKPRFQKGKGLRGKKGAIKRLAMFRKLRTARFLKVEVTGDGLAIGYTGRAAYLASIHQEGLAGQVARGGPTVTYPVRKLLGMTDAELEMMHDRLLGHIVK